MGLKIAEALLESLETESVRIVHWKGNRSLDEALEGKKDLDLLIHRDDRDAFYKVLARVNALRVESQVWAAFEGVEDWLLFDQLTGRILHVHAHFNMPVGMPHTKQIVLPWSEHIFDSARAHPQLKWTIPDATFELLITLTRITAERKINYVLLRRYKLNQKFLRDILWLREQSSASQLNQLLDHLGLQSDHRLVSQIFNCENIEVSSIAFSRSLNQQLRKHWSVSLLFSIMNEIQMELIRIRSRRKIRSGRYVTYRKTLLANGFILALVGSDGAGKSSISKELTEWLTYKLDVHALYLGSGDGQKGLSERVKKGLHKYIRLLKRTGVIASIPRTNQVKVGGKPVAAERNFVRKTYALFDLLLLWRKLRLLRSASALVSQGSVFIADRYPQSQFIEINDGPMLQNGQSFRWAASRELSAFGKCSELGPQFLLKLKVSPETALLRKPDHDFRTLKLKAEIIDDLVFANVRTTVVDAEQPFKEVLLECKKLVWAMLLSRSTLQDRVQ
jgi:thymidylate kinase